MPDTSDRPITTIQTALQWAYALLADQSETHQLDARILMCEVLHVKQEYLIRYPDRVLTTEEITAFQALVSQRARGVPIPYLLGKQVFYDIQVSVTPDVLIPRPETELLVEQAISWAKGRHAFIVDVGAGSGVIALVLAKHLPTAHVTGIEISPTALAIARANSRHLGLESRIRWLEGNLLEPLVAQGETVDLIVANLPYIATEELETLPVARYEPYKALHGGASGLELIEQFLQNAPRVLRPGGLLLMEIGMSQGPAVQKLAQAAFPDRQVKVETDLAGHDRIVRVQ